MRQLGPRAARPGWWLLLTVVWALGCGAPATVELPELDTSAMERPVAAKIESARRAIRERPDSAHAWGRLGEAYQAHALYPEAVASYRQAVERAPGDYRWPYLAALAQQKTDLAAAVGYFEAAVRRRPHNPALFVSFGDVLVQLGELERAAEQYRGALAQDPASSHALYGLSQIALAAGDLTAAAEHLGTAAELAPHHGEVHALLAQVHHRRGETEKARLAELRARAWPDATRAQDPVTEEMEAEAVSSRAHTLRGRRHAKAGRHADAEAEFRRVLEIRPGNARDFANLGGTLARQGKLEEALASYHEALRLEPEDPWTHNNLALALADQGRLAEAAEHLKTAITSDVSYAEAHHNLGLVRYRGDRFDEAVGHYEEALRQNPAFVDAYNELGTALAARGRLAEAAVHWRQALAIDRLHLSALYNLSVALARLGEHQEAIARLREGLAVAPNSSRLVSLLAWELATAPEAELRDAAEARRLATRLADAYPRQATSADVLAAALAEAGDFEQAAQAAQRGVLLARAAGQGQLAEQIRRRLALYENGRAYRQPGQ